MNLKLVRKVQRLGKSLLLLDEERKLEIGEELEYYGEDGEYLHAPIKGEIISLSNKRILVKLETGLNIKLENKEQFGWI